MANIPSGSDFEAFLTGVSVLGPRVLEALVALGGAERRMGPGGLDSIRGDLLAVRQRLGVADEAFRARAVPESLTATADRLLASAGHAASALSGFARPLLAGGGIQEILDAMRSHCLAQESLFPLWRVLPPVDRFFLEPAQRAPGVERPPPPPSKEETGLFNAANTRDERGGFSLYVPESYDASRATPLVVALHGGSGHGADFIWTWLREARSRGFLLLAPTARGSTWSFTGPDLDAGGLRRIVEHVGERWCIDAAKVLLTGLSDGATYTLFAGLQEGMPFTAFAPISGVLHPSNFANGNMQRVAGRRVYLVHGALDWMFPVDTARAARDALEVAGAALVYREIQDLSHTYPREENPAILDWFLGD